MLKPSRELTPRQIVLSTSATRLRMARGALVVTIFVNFESTEEKSLRAGYLNYSSLSS